MNDQQNTTKLNLGLNALASRRNFIKGIGGAALGYGLFQQHMFPTRVLAAKTTNTTDFKPLTISVAGKAPQALWTFLGTLATETLSNILADSVKDWLSSLTHQEKSCVIQVNDSAAYYDFNDFSHDAVQINSIFTVGVAFYGIGRGSPLNICIPFFILYQNKLYVATVITGPILVGLALAAYDWANVSTGHSVTEGVFPIYGDLNYTTTFDQTMRRPYKAETLAGNISVGYTANPANQQGLVEVVATGDDAKELFNQNYLLNWA